MAVDGSLQVISLSENTGKAAFVIETPLASRFVISESPLDSILAYPGKETGTVQLLSLTGGENRTLNAEDKEVRFLALNYDGSLLATTSVDVCRLCRSGTIR